MTTYLSEVEILILAGAVTSINVTNINIQVMSQQITGRAKDMYHTVQAPLNTYPVDASRNNSNGTDQTVVDRSKIREICEGWGLYRDAAEWQNYRSMFHDDAYIATSWSQGPVNQFIESSKEAFSKQKDGMIYILHRIIGQTVDVQGNRAVSKMKVTITCRIEIDGIEMDNEAGRQWEQHVLW